ncbi:5'/3'-nucleotidase SurE [Marinobacter sp. JSM 1782161]|uniref:5'/3'-nucleotidase SurE n=1 Tax=Marinobacter sp. JSM 1782161 TaxID=2685906 RepID=UPI001402A5A9|nr:5'/3'-nucleotidase SurE [Marinobacter sp. JSM 1782161]
MKTSLAPLALAGTLLFSGQASALNILLTNDDGWETDNIQTMFSALQAAGHNVIMSAPCTGQSGKGGALNFLKPVSVDDSKAGQQEYCVGDTDETVAFEDFTEGTPVMAVLHGLDVVAPAVWGAAPDLVISGPNEGNNLGYMNNNSGTLGAAMISIARGIPAIAVSAADGDATKAATVAQIVIDIVDQLDAGRAAGEALLPPFTGLNVNTPDDVANHLGYRFTDVAWNAGGYDAMFVEDMSENDLMMSYVAASIMAADSSLTEAEALAQARAAYAGASGISFTGGLVDDDSANAEGKRVQEGYVTISTIDAHVQASRAKVALTAQKLNALSE